jgi:tRNA threonylcarbamoyladenosine biosynthesis protein TsaB
MLLLAIDTSGRNGSLALAQVRGSAVEVVEEVALAGSTFSAQLVPQTAALLEKHGYGKADLAGFAVVSGPGSFTGLRVGLAAIKAMAEILRKPIAAVSLLEAVARSALAEKVPSQPAGAEAPDQNQGLIAAVNRCATQSQTSLANPSGRVFSVLDAGRGDFYVGDYELGPPVRMDSERLLSREEFSAEWKGQLVVTTDVNIADVVRGAGFRVELVGYPRIGDIARLGWERIQRGETVLPEGLEANYIRRTDAEIFSKPKL